MPVKLHDVHFGFMMNAGDSEHFNIDLWSAQMGRVVTRDALIPILHYSRVNPIPCSFTH